jgi:predicted nucleic acid-binding protein
VADEADLTMVLVDSTVWIDFLRGGATPEVGEVERLLSEGEDVCTCGVVLTEVLQGIREDDDYRRASLRFNVLLFLPMARETFVRAAELYRSLRRRGITIRKPVDCMIASVCLEHGASLLHNDRDFDPMESHCGLKVVKTAGKPKRRSGRSREDLA